MNVGMNDFVRLDAKMLQKWLDGEEGRAADEGQKMQFLSPAMQKRVYGPVPTGTKVMKNDANDKNANGCARRSFLDFVLRECNADSKEDLPPVVKTAMKLNSGWLHQRQDWNEGKNRPLTVRRIKAVMTAIYAHRAGVEGWNSDSKVCKDFWNGLSSELKTALRQSKNADLFKSLFRNYRTLVQATANGANNAGEVIEPKDFLEKIGMVYKAGLESNLANPIPLGLFKTGGAGNDLIGRCLVNQLSSTEYQPSLSNMSEDGNGVPSEFEKAIRGFNREGSILTINFKVKNKNGGLDDKSITLIGGANSGSLKLKTEGGTEIKVTRNGENGTFPYSQLEKKLKNVTGLADQKLYALLNKPSSGGLTSYGVAENQDYQKAFLKRMKLPANGPYSELPQFVGKLTVVPKQQGSRERKFVFDLSVKGNIVSSQQPGLAFFSYDRHDSGNYQSLNCKCEYKVLDNEEKFRVSNLRYTMAMSLQNIEQIEDLG